MFPLKNDLKCLRSNSIEMPGCIGYCTRIYSFTRPYPFLILIGKWLIQTFPKTDPLKDL